MAEIRYAELLLKKRNNIILGVFIVCSLIVSRNIYQKQMDQYAKLKSMIEQEKEKIQSLDHIVSLNEKLKKYKERSWDTLDSNTIIESIFEAGHASQVKIRNIDPGKAKEEKNYTTIPFALNCEATYKNFLRFTKDLETQKRLWKVKGVSIAAGGLKEGVGRDPTLRVDVTLEAVYLK